jgi:hypothetical protein
VFMNVIQQKVGIDGYNNIIKQKDFLKAFFLF